jgi:hypothetical protein
MHMHVCENSVIMRSCKHVCAGISKKIAAYATYACVCIKLIRVHMHAFMHVAHITAHLVPDDKFNSSDV